MINKAYYSLLNKPQSTIIVTSGQQWCRLASWGFPALENVMSDAKTVIEGYVQAKNWNATTTQNQLLNAVIEQAGHDDFMAFVNSEAEEVKSLDSPADRTLFYFNHKELLLVYANMLAKRLKQTDVQMLGAMSFDKGKRPIANRDAVVKAIFLDDDRYQPYFPVLTSSLVTNVLRGMKHNILAHIERQKAL